MRHVAYRSGQDLVLYGLELPDMMLAEILNSYFTMSPVMSKPIQVEKAGPISISMVVLGIVLIIVALLALFKIAFTEMGNWDYWVLIVGAGVVLVGAIWFISYFLNVRKFRKLIVEKSKASFIKELDNLEYLAWRLPSRYEEELLAKKKNFGLK